MKFDLPYVTLKRMTLELSASEQCTLDLGNPEQTDRPY